MKLRETLKKHPQMQTVICAALLIALLAGIFVPTLSMSAQPQDPLADVKRQDISVLRLGDAAADGEDAAQGKKSGGAGQQSDENAPQETETPAQTLTEQQETEYLQNGTVENASASDGDGEDTQSGLAAVLTWKKYGTEPVTVVGQAGQSVGRKILRAQLDGGMFVYDFSLTGTDAESAQILAVRFSDVGTKKAVPERGAVPMELQNGEQSRNYLFTVDVKSVQTMPDGTGKEKTVQFRFLLQLTDGADLSLVLGWMTKNGAESAVCDADGSCRVNVRSEDLQDGHFAYTLSFAGVYDSARILKAAYRSSDGEEGSLSANGSLILHTDAGRSYGFYYFTVLAQANVQGQTGTAEYTFTLKYEQETELSLEFLWYRKNAEAVREYCAADSTATVTVRHNELSGDELTYALSLAGKSAEGAEILSAKTQDGALSVPSGTLKLPRSSQQTLTITAQYMLDGVRKLAQFTLTVRYCDDLRLKMTYTLADGEMRELVCENKKTVTADAVYDDELSGGQLHYEFMPDGEDAAGLRVGEISLYQTGSGQTQELAVPSGSAVLSLHAGKTGENVFTVQAAGEDGQNYTFTFNVPLKHRGDKNVTIRTNLKDGQTVTNEAAVDLTVEAWSEDESDRKNYILATGTDTKLTVTLDGKVLSASGASGTVSQYVMIPENPEKGDTNEHILTVYAEDAYGNSGTLTLTLPGERTEKGQSIGTADIYIDMSVLGLGIFGPVRYDVLSGEPVSYSVAKAVWDYEAPEPFGRAQETFGWPAERCKYSGTLDVGFYLQTLDDGSGLGRRAKALKDSWGSYGASEDAVFASIDRIFGAESDMAILWRCIYRNGIPLSEAGTGVGEFDYTMGSGWMYSLGGETFYPGASMSDYHLKDGDVLTLRYTLCYGWDVGGGQAGYGSNTGYCISCINGKFSVRHNFEQKQNEQGKSYYLCTCCGITQDCLHENTVCRDLGNGTCALVCTDCEKALEDAQEHDFEYENTDDGQHKKTCRRCNLEQTEEHVWQTDEDTATCMDEGTLYESCPCGAERQSVSAKKSHEAENEYEHDEKKHWQTCRFCGEQLAESLKPHQYVQYGEDWKCEQCGAVHGFICDGEMVFSQLHATCISQNYHCADCGCDAKGQELMEEYHRFVCGTCAYCGAADPDYIPPEQESGERKKYYGGNGT